MNNKFLFHDSENLGHKPEDEAIKIIPPKAGHKTEEKPWALAHGSLLIVIILIAIILRFYQLGKIPPSPDWDEASLGYNAYSILTTGRDEYGQSLPIVLRSFDDYKPALYAYLTIPSILIFGLNTFAVRFPSAFFGVLTVIALYYLMKEMFPKLSTIYHLLTTTLLAISPWHLQFSRIAFESNIGLSLNVFTVLFFLKGLRNPWMLIISSLFAGLALYVYQAEKVFTPLLVLALVVIFRKELLLITKKYLALAILTAVIISLPLVYYTLTDKQALMRARGVSAFADQTPFLERSAQKLLNDKEKGDFLGLILDNRRVQYILASVNGYLSHYDFNWLFINGDDVRHHAPNMGLLYLWELPFVLTGIYLLIFGEFPKKTKYLIFSWFLMAPIPASITSGVPHAVRTLNFLPSFQIFAAIGLIGLIRQIYFWRRSFKLVIVIVTFSFFIFNFAYYLDQYFVQLNYFTSQDWQYGYQEAVEEIKRIEERYDKIIVSNKPYLDQSYIFFLFYLKYDPLTYQNESKVASGGFAENHYFSKYEFRSVEWDKEEKKSNFLFVGRASDFPEGVKTLRTVEFLDGKPAIKIVEG